MELRCNQNFGSFVILQQLASSAFGEVWLAQDTAHHNRQVVLKVSRQDLPGNFVNREFYALRNLQHECITRLLGHGTAEGRHYLVLEWLEGATLGNILREIGGIMPTNANQILFDILSALEYLHRQAIVHRDLKPDNVFITTEGRAKLLDFGIAQLGWDRDSQAQDGPQTQTGQIVGTPVYMAPEQFEGAGVDGRADLYAFGVLLYEIFTGRPPFAGHGLVELIKQKLFTAPPSLSAARPDLPAGLEAIYLRLLAKDKAERYDSAAEVVRVLVESLLSARASTDTKSSFRPHTAYCPYCAQLLPEKANSCAKCGKRWTLADSTHIFCSTCRQGTLNAPYCQHCGAPQTRILSVPAWPSHIDSDRLTVVPESRAGFSSEASIYTEAVFLPAQPPTLPGFSEMSVSAPIHQKLPVFQVGTLLSERYLVKKYLGEGGLAHIYLMADQESLLEQELVLKVPKFYEDPKRLERLVESQAKWWKLLSDREPSRIVRLFDVRQITAGSLTSVGMFMENMPGGSLGRFLKEDVHGYPHNREQLAKILGLFQQACEAVRVLHEQEKPLLHRDLKPANFLLDASAHKCKLSDFDLVVRAANQEEAARLNGGTPSFMAPECFAAKYSFASDIFALGVTLYNLLTGELPFGTTVLHQTQPPRNPTSINPLVPPELSDLVLHCLEHDPQQRPPSVASLLHDLSSMGLTDERSNTAPLNLARLLIQHLPAGECEFLVKTLEQRGFRSVSDDPAQRQAELIEEYCYVVSPYEALGNNCTGQKLVAIAQALGLDIKESASREALLTAILQAIGFLPGSRQTPGLDATRTLLEDLLSDLAHATTIEQCNGMVLSGLTELERIVGVLVRFYGQLFYGPGISDFLKPHAHDKPLELMTFGQKKQALQNLSNRPKGLRLSERVKRIVKFPLLPKSFFDKLTWLLKERSKLVHESESGDFQEIQSNSQHILTTARAALSEIATSSFPPRVVQIIARQDDVYGRHFYSGRDDRGRTERIFTPLPLTVGQLYLFYSLTNPVCINPLIFPYEVTG